MKIKADLSKYIGQKYGNREIIGVSQTPGYVKTQCDCKGEFSVKDAPLKNLLKGKSLSCGKCGQMTLRIKQTMERQYGVEGAKEKQKEGMLKRKETYKAKTGYDNPMQNPESKRLAKETLKKNYGVDNILKLSSNRKKAYRSAWDDEAREKRIKTNNEKYGGNAPMCSTEIKNRSKETSVRKYGVENYSKSDEFKKSMSDKNPMHNSVNVERNRDSIERNWGTRVLTDTTAFKDLAVKYKMENISIRQYLEDNKIKHVRYAAVKNVYAELGEEAALEYIERSKTERLSELELFFIKTVMPLEKFDRKVLSNAEKGWRPDFRLIDDIYVNVDGHIIHSERYGKMEFHHVTMRKDFENEGKRLFQFYDDEVKKTPLIVRSIIEKAIGKNEEVSCQELTFVTMRKGLAASYLKEWHLLGRGRFSHCIGLETKEGELMAIMSYRVNDGSIEISRYSPKLGMNIAGGFTKLVEFVRRSHPYKDLIYICDLRFSTGKSLESCGFTKINEEPSFCWTYGLKRFSKSYCMAKDGKSEKEVADEMKLHKLWDAGQRKYVLPKKNPLTSLPNPASIIKYK